jgi:Ser/Thr protein kinase RdoA (MazF antagonist)
MAGEAERLAAGEAALAPGLPRQLAHGDFWDDNVFLQDETRCSSRLQLHGRTGPGSTTWP